MKKKIVFIAVLFAFTFLSCKNEVKTGAPTVQKEEKSPLLEEISLPEYHFTDLDGQTYTPENTKGKIVVLKCWYLSCMPCVVEIPTLNRIKGEYEGRNDILFLSLCMDSQRDLKAFLKENVFDYKQIANQRSYLSDKLKIDRYPTHFVINKQGFIIKKTNKYEEMADVLKKEAGKM